MPERLTTFHEVTYICVYVLWQNKLEWTKYMYTSIRKINNVNEVIYSYLFTQLTIFIPVNNFHVITRMTRTFKNWDIFFGNIYPLGTEMSSRNFIMIQLHPVFSHFSFWNLMILNILLHWVTWNSHSFYFLSKGGATSHLQCPNPFNNLCFLHVFHKNENE